jgi:hypothetical protein
VVPNRMSILIAGGGVKYPFVRAIIVNLSEITAAITLRRPYGCTVVLSGPRPHS